jgi:hypothetical protein
MSDRVKEFGEFFFYIIDTKCLEWKRGNVKRKKRKSLAEICWSLK